MTRSQLNPLPVYFDRYIEQCDDVDVHTALLIALDELEHAPLDEWQRIGDRVYAPGKWTIKDILQHLIDTERVFSYRATSFARGEAKVKGYDEEHYGREARANRRTLTDLHEEALAVRRSTIHQFRSFDEAMLSRVGQGFKGPYSVHSIGFIAAGHQRWHFRIINERYRSLEVNSGDRRTFEAMTHAHPGWPTNTTTMITNTVTRPLHWSLLLGTALVVTLLLYFIDEGRYSLEGLFTVGNMIAMGIYLVGLVLGLFLTARLFAKREPGPLRTALVLSTGSLVGFVIGLGLILGLGALQMVG